MKLSIGIVGLPNVGKSTLFNALLKKQVADVAPYPFCTIEKNIGVVEVPDERLQNLAKVTGIEKIVPAVVEFYDIAGLVKRASKGEGLGNKFLAYIRETAAILHVVRIFEDENIVHVENKVDPQNDIEIVNTELIFADLATLEKRKPPKVNATKEEKFAFEVVSKVKTYLNQGKLAKKINLSYEEKKAVSDLNLLTIKPCFYAFNLSEKQLEDMGEWKKKIKNILKSVGESGEKAFYIPICAKLENEILLLSENEQKEYLKQYDLQETGLNRLIKIAYEILTLISFFTTTGGKEVRAWTIKKGTQAIEAAEVVHTDFKKYFIKADVIPYESFVKSGSWTNARSQGEVTTVGKDYEIKDGEVIEFKIGI